MQSLRSLLGPTLALAFNLVPVIVFAQAGPPGPPGTISQGPMTVERVHNGFLVAPEAKVTRFDARTSELVGGYAGWLAEDTIFIGAGAYFGTGAGSNRGLGYGGLVLQWLLHPTDRIGLSAKGLIGGGRATLPQTVIELEPLLPSLNALGLMPGRIDIDRPVSRTVTFRSHEDFFVAEPEIDFLMRLAGPVRLSVGVGYRVIGAEHGDDSRIRGATGSVGLHIGGGL